MLLRHVGDEQVLHDGGAEMAVGEAIGEISRSAKLLWRDAAAKNGSTHVDEPCLLLRMDTDVVAMNIRGRLLRLGRIKRKADDALEFGEEGIGSPALFKEQKLQPGFFAALTKHLPGAEDFSDASRDSDNLIRQNESVQPNTEMRIRRKPSADAQREPDFTQAIAKTLRRSEADIVDFRIGTPVAASGDGNFELAREVVELRIAAQRFVDRKGQRRRVDQFLVVEPCQRAAGDVASDIAAGPGRGQAGCPQALEKIGKRFYGDPMELNVLADSDVCNTARISFRKIGQDANLPARQESVGDADANHEVLRGVALAILASNNSNPVTLCVNAPGAKVRADPLRWNR